MKDRYMELLALQQELAKVKKQELELRKELCNELFEGRVGEFKKEFETDRYEVEAQSKVTHNIDKTAFAAIVDELSDEELECIRYKPELDIRKWRKLPEDAILHEVVTEKPATPTLKITLKVE